MKLSKMDIAVIIVFTLNIGIGFWVANGISNACGWGLAIRYFLLLKEKE